MFKLFSKVSIANGDSLRELPEIQDDGNKRIAVSIANGDSLRELQ